jgi:TRAP-type C4-dicarboxylate transport system permease small subunit
MNNEVREPISISGALGLVLSTGLTMLATFWPERLTVEAQAAIFGFGNAVIWLGVIWYSRRHSTPIAAPSLPVGTPVLVATPAGAPADTPPPDAIVALRSDLKGAQPI